MPEVPSCGNVRCSSCRTVYVSALTHRTEDGVHIVVYDPMEPEDEYESDDDERESSGLHYYSYRPILKFRGESPPWYGLELEVTTDHPRQVVDLAHGYGGDLLYCKEDSSVEGAEIVSHPMSYDWAMANFPWGMLPALRREADATVVSAENGIHVHVSRDGFSSSSHMLRWMKLWYRNPNDIQRIARRRHNSWAAFNPEQRQGQKEHVKRGRSRHYNSDEDGTLWERHVAINTTNRETLEVRVFASTLRPQRAKAALQLVAGSVEYTRQLTSDAITHRHGWDWPAFISWAGKSGAYPDLVSENRIRR